MAMNKNEGSSAYPPNPDVKSGSCLMRPMRVGRRAGSLSALAVSVAGAMMHGEKKSPPSLSQAGGFLVEVQLAKANGAPTPRR